MNRSSLGSCLVWFIVASTQDFASHLFFIHSSSLLLLRYYHSIISLTMPSVADELAELRKRFLAKQHGAKLQNAQGLSTPEQEQTALKDAQSKSRAATYTKDAAAQLQQGTKAVSQELDFSLKSSTQKKQEGLQKKQAAEQLKQGSKAVSQDLDFQMQQKALKQKDHQNKKDAAENLQSFNLTKSESQEITTTTTTRLNQQPPQRNLSPKTKRTKRRTNWKTFPSWKKCRVVHLRQHSPRQ